MLLARAYNNSIYLMLAVPYLTVGLIGFMIYRHLRIRDAQAQALPPSPGVDTPEPRPGGRACSLPSTAADS